MKFDWELCKKDLFHAALFLLILTAILAIPVAFGLGLALNPNWFWLLAYPTVCGIAAFLIHRWTY